MAYYPCDRGPHYNPRKNFLWYFAWGSGLEMTRKRLRYCASHSADIEHDLAELEVTPESATERAYGARPNCFACGQPGDEGSLQLFVTGYPADQERKDYWTNIHEHCTPSFFAAVDAIRAVPPR